MVGDTGEKMWGVTINLLQGVIYTIFYLHVFSLSWASLGGDREESLSEAVTKEARLEASRLLEVALVPSVASAVDQSVAEGRIHPGRLELGHTLGGIIDPLRCCRQEGRLFSQSHRE